MRSNLPDFARCFVELSRTLCTRAPACLLPAFCAELTQHAVEWRLGMFRIGDGIAPGREHSVWLLFGALKAGGFVATSLLAKSYLAARLPTPVRPSTPARLALVLIGVLTPLYLGHYQLVARAIGAPPAMNAALLVADAAIVSLMALAAGVQLHVRSFREGVRGA